MNAMLANQDLKTSIVFRSIKRTFMKNTSKYTLIFYATVSLASAGLIFVVLHILQWPLVSELITGTALFVHSIILARSAKDLFSAAHEKGLVTQWLFHLQNGYDVSNSNSEIES